MVFSLDGVNADWQACLGKKGVELSDAEHAKLRAAIPAVELLDEDDRKVLIRNAEGYEDLWEKPRWILIRTHRRPEKGA